MTSQRAADVPRRETAWSRVAGSDRLGTRDAWLAIMRAALPILFLVAAGASPGEAQTVDDTQPLTSVTFASGASGLDPDAREQLRAVVAWAHDHPWRLVVIEGHADPAGSPTDNLALSQDRADAVRAELIALGLPLQRLVTAAYGAETPNAQRRVVVRGTLEDFRDLVQPRPGRVR
jgi:outer membrane protein OmpA-like peptidoglycan-associated protein